MDILFFLCIFNGFRFSLIYLDIEKSVAGADMAATLMGHATLLGLQSWNARAREKPKKAHFEAYSRKGAKIAEEIQIFIEIDKLTNR